MGNTHDTIDSSLGSRLRELREEKGWSLREVASRAGVNHGYLSQLERGEVTEPAPSMLHKLATGYQEPVSVLMEWAGYVESGLSPNQARALSYLGDDPSDEEVRAIKAILDVLRSKRATFAAEPGSLDSLLRPDDLADIRRRSVALLRRADAYGVVPTPLDQLLEVAHLVAAGEISLDTAEKKQLRKMFGALVDRVWSKLQGAIHFRAREVWVQPDLYLPRKRFVTAHEIGHDLLPWQRDTIAYLDDERRLRADIRIEYERQANQVAIELLAQGDRLRREADDSNLTMASIRSLSTKYQLSFVATARRVVEESRKPAALAIRFRGQGLGPSHIYSSAVFDQRFGWSAGGIPRQARDARDSGIEGLVSTLHCADLSGQVVEMNIEVYDTRFASAALFVPNRPHRRLISIHR